MKRVFVAVSALTILGGVKVESRKLETMVFILSISAVRRDYCRLRASNFTTAVGGSSDCHPGAL